MPARSTVDLPQAVCQTILGHAWLTHVRFAGLTKHAMVSTGHKGLAAAGRLGCLHPSFGLTSDVLIVSILGFPSWCSLSTIGWCASAMGPAAHPTLNLDPRPCIPNPGVQQLSVADCAGGGVPQDPEVDLHLRLLHLRGAGRPAGLHHPHPRSPPEAVPGLLRVQPGVTSRGNYPKSYPISQPGQALSGALWRVSGGVLRSLKQHPDAFESSRCEPCPSLCKPAPVRCGGAGDLLRSLREPGPGTGVEKRLPDLMPPASMGITCKMCCSARLP